MGRAQPDVAIVIPAFNEAVAIAGVIGRFHDQAPEAQIWVVDNNSDDGTGTLAREAIARTGGRGGVLDEPRQGKSNAVRRAFTAVEADVYVMVDGDATYDAADLPRLLAPVVQREADMVVGNRFSAGPEMRHRWRRFHLFGNNLVRRLINGLFNAGLTDIMSGYRVMNRRFVKLFPIMSGGFEMETEMTIHALDKRFRLLEVPIRYRERPAGSRSKLNTFRDGLKILRLILSLFKNYRPRAFFLFVSSLFTVAGLLTGAPVIYEFIAYRYIYRVPSAILATGLMIFAAVFFSLGLVLETIVNYQRFDYERRLLDYDGTY